MTNRIETQTSNDVNFGVVDVSAATFPGYVYQENQLCRTKRKKGINKTTQNKQRFQFKGKNYTDTLRARYKAHRSIESRILVTGLSFNVSITKTLSSFTFGLALKNLV